MIEGASEDFNEDNDQLHEQNSFYWSTRNHLPFFGFFFLIFLHMKLKEESVNMPITCAQFYTVLSLSLPQLLQSRLPEVILLHFIVYTARYFVTDQSVWEF